MGLTSWTRVLSEEAALPLLALAEPGLPLATWEERAHAELPHAKRDTRRDLIRTVLPLVDHDGTFISDSAFLRLFHAGSPARRRQLVWGRYLLGQPWMKPLLDELLQPRVSASEEPLAPLDADHVTPADWDALLDRHLDSDTPPEARAKTRRVLIMVLDRVGVLDGEEPDHRVHRARPDSLAFAWLVGHELDRSGRAELGLGEAVRDSFAARLFAADPVYARTCLDAGVAAGLLRRGALAGSPRLHPVGAA